MLRTHETDLQEAGSINIGLSKTIRKIFSDPILNEDSDLEEECGVSQQFHQAKFQS